MPVTASPANARTTSPSRRPAAAAGLSGFHRHDEHTRGHGQLVRARHRARNRHGLPADADVAAADPAVANQPRRDEPRRVARDREAQALRRQNHRGVDADHFAARRDERTAGVAGVERRVGLDDVVHQPARSRAQRAAERADDAGRHRVMEAVRVADRDRDLPHPHRARIAERRPRQRRAGERIDADRPRGRCRRPGRRHPPRIERPSGSDDGHAAGAFDDVAVGEDEAVRREEDAGAAAALRPRSSRRPARPSRRRESPPRIRVQQLGVVWLRDHTSIVTKGDGRRHHPYGSSTGSRRYATAPERVGPALRQRLLGFQPGPRTTRPGFAPVCSPSFSTCTPLTHTCRTPVEYWCGFS